jgi:hypothetical protein
MTSYSIALHLCNLFNTITDSKAKQVAPTSQTLAEILRSVSSKPCAKQLDRKSIPFKSFSAHRDFPDARSIAPGCVSFAFSCNLFAHAAIAREPLNLRGPESVAPLTVYTRDTISTRVRRSD